MLVVGPGEYIALRGCEMRMAVMAAGAVGGYFGGRMAAAGHDVAFIARGAHQCPIHDSMELHGVLYGVPRGTRHARIDEMLKFVELDDRRHSYVREFSGGMKRRLEIARGLLHHPKIIFLDEPTLGLDPQTRNHMWDYLGRLNEREGITVFFTTHYMDEADRNADTIAIIDHGSIIASGTGEELKRQTRKDSLEDAFLELTGHDIREESASALEHLRVMRRARGR